MVWLIFVILIPFENPKSLAATERQRVFLLFAGLITLLTQTAVHLHEVTRMLHFTGILLQINYRVYLLNAENV